MFLGVAVSILAILSIVYLRKKLSTPKRRSSKQPSFSKQSLPERLISNDVEAESSEVQHLEEDSVVDGPSMVKQFAQRSKNYARRSAWTRTIGIILPLAGIALVIQVAPYISVSDFKYWSEKSVLVDPSLQTIVGENSVFRSNVKSAASRRNKRLVKVSNAKVAVEKYTSERNTAKAELATYDSKYNETSLKQELNKSVLKIEKSIMGLETKLSGLEAQAKDISDVKSYQKTQDNIRTTRLERDKLREQLQDLKNKNSDVQHLKDKVNEGRQELLNIESNSEENLAKAIAKQDLENKYLQEAENLYGIAVNEYLATLEQAKGKNSSETYQSSLNTLRLIGLLLLSGIAWQLFRLSDYYLKLSTFYQSRADLINAYMINDYELDVSVTDTLNMFSPNQTYSSSRSPAHEMSAENSNPEELSIANRR